MKPIVLYESRTGFSEKYAEWIAESLKCEAKPLHGFDPAGLEACDTVVFGGGLHAVGIRGFRKFRRLMSLPGAKGKKVAVFATGASPAREEAVNHVRDANLSPEERAQYGFFYMRGGFDYARLQKIDKIAMTLLKLKIRMKPEKKRTPDERGMLSAYAKPVDFTRKRNTRPLIDWLGVLPGEHDKPE